MLETLQTALIMVATWQNLLAMATGMVIGVIIGCIPGLTVTMAVALALPFTFYLPPLTGILLLMGIYKGGNYAGCISAILIKTPGTPASAATVEDGYALTQKGQAGKALNITLYASVIADCFSNIGLILFAGFIAGIALSFGPPEFFTLILFSLTIVAVVSGDSMVKGLFAGALGLLLATVGMDGVHGTQRFSFGNTDAMAGLNFIPVLMGIFAFPEIIDACVKKASQITKDIKARIDDSKVTKDDMKLCIGPIIRGSCIGVGLGVLPGIGPAVATFISYGAAKQSSKHPELFGKGSLEGIAAAESGNSGTCGSSLVPTMALGVPGDAVTGIILGAFIMHGLTPGPLLFQNELSLVYALYLGLLTSSVFMLIAGYFCIRAFSKVANIPKKYLFPAVLVLCFFGTYAINNSMFDVLVMIVFGIIGYGMRALTIPAPPLVIAFILGPLFEDNLRRSLIMSGGDFSIFYRSTICWVFIALFVFTVTYMVWTKRKKGTS